VLVVLWVVVVEVVLVGVGLLVVVVLVTGVAPPPLALVLVLPLEPQPTATAAMRASAAIAPIARYENHDQLWRSIDSSCSTELTAYGVCPDRDTVRGRSGFNRREG
jgi:hypothetical protein